MKPAIVPLEKSRSSGVSLPGKRVERGIIPGMIQSWGQDRGTAPALFTGPEMGLFEMVLCGFCNNDVFLCTFRTGEPDNIPGSRAINLGL